MIDASRWVLDAKGRSREIRHKSVLTKPASIRILESSIMPIIGTYAIWQCAHCTGKRVFGCAPPEPDRKAAFIRCQSTYQNEVHTFAEMAGEWAGPENTLPAIPTGGLPCRGGKRCACEK